MRKRFRISCLLALLLVPAAACSASTDPDGVASANGAARASATPSLSPLEQGIRFTRCMRQHGVPMPDPQPDGDLPPVSGDKDALDANVVQAARDACRQYEPVLSGPERSAKDRAGREYSRCMRAHGVADFPDPDASGHIELPAEQNDPDYDSAKATCDARTRSAGSSPEATRR